MISGWPHRDHCQTKRLTIVQRCKFVWTLIKFETNAKFTLYNFLTTGSLSSKLLHDLILYERFQVVVNVTAPLSCSKQKRFDQVLQQRHWFNRFQNISKNSPHNITSNDITFTKFLSVIFKFATGGLFPCSAIPIRERLLSWNKVIPYIRTQKDHFYKQTHVSVLVNPHQAVCCRNPETTRLSRHEGQAHCWEDAWLVYTP